MNESPAFGLSSNNKSAEKGPILVDKSPTLETDTSLKKPVPFKP